MIVKDHTMLIESEENLLIDFQFKIQERMNFLFLDNKKLSVLCGIPEERISEILTAEGEPTVREIGRIFASMSCNVIIDVIGE